jgi:hypothetical protein
LINKPDYIKNVLLTKSRQLCQEPFLRSVLGRSLAMVFSSARRVSLGDASVARGTSFQDKRISGLVV